MDKYVVFHTEGGLGKNIAARIPYRPRMRASVIGIFSEEDFGDVTTLGCCKS